MSKFVFARVSGLIAVGTLLTVGAAGAHAADQAGASAVNESQVIVSRPNGDQESVRVVVSDLDVGSEYDREVLENRIDRASRQVCDVIAGSAIDRLPSALSCLDQARAGALAQLDARGWELADARTAAASASAQ